MDLIEAVRHHVPHEAIGLNCFCEGQIRGGITGLQEGKVLARISTHTTSAGVALRSVKCEGPQFAKHCNTIC